LCDFPGGIAFQKGLEGLNFYLFTFFKKKNGVFIMSQSLKPLAVVLDSYPLDKGDVAWDGIAGLVNLTRHDQTMPSQVIERIQNAEIVLTNKVRIRAEHMAAATHLKYISVLGTGYDCVDPVAARQKGIPVSNVPFYSSASTSQTAIALLLELAQSIGLHDRLVHEGKWASCPYYSFWESPLIELEGKTLCIVGLGAIGGRVAKIAQAMGMEIIVALTSGREPKKDCPYRELPLKEAFQAADFITLHCPLTPQTRSLINTETISYMKKSCRIINNSRGPLIDESALAHALSTGQIAAAAVDVLGTEPPIAANPLLKAPNCIITPHISWATTEARRKLLEITAHNISSFLQGTPVNIVN